MLRSALRHSALSGFAAWYKLRGRMAALREPRVQLMYMHDLMPDEEKHFRRLLEVLGRDHTFIGHSEAVSRILSGRIDRPYVSISFDDGLKGCLRIAEIMDEFGAKGCFFVLPSMVEETDESKIAEFCVRRLHIQPTAFLSWDDVERLLERGHEIGSHTMTHPDLASVSTQQMQDEIATSYSALKRRIGGVRHFAWPYGRFFHFNSHAARLVFEAGFESCASAERGCHKRRAENPLRLCLRRDNTVLRSPLDHTLYFMARNSLQASESTNQWPAGWRDLTQ